MKVIKNVTLTVLLSGLAGMIKGQTIVPLAKNAIVPDIELGHVWNSPGKKIRMGQLRGKAIILDFWHTGCAPCIASFSKMDSLQQRFGDSIKIFLVAPDSDEKVRKLFGRIKPKIPNLTVITGDTLLHKIFVPYTYPHHSWIDQEGRYRYATFGHNATEGNIAAFLKGMPASFSEKKYGSVNIDDGLLAVAGNAPAKVEVEYSVLLKGIEQYLGGGKMAVAFDSATGFPKKFAGYGQPQLNLLVAAFSQDVCGFPPSLIHSGSTKRVILEVGDSASIFPPADESQLDQWRRGNLVAYETAVLPGTADDLYKKMQGELNRALSVKGEVELRPVRHLALVRKNGQIVKRAIDGRKTEFVKGFIHYRNTPLWRIVMKMEENSFISKLPIVDCTGIDYPIDFSIATASFYKLDELKAELHKIGLDLVERTDSIPMLIIKDNKALSSIAVR